jgi:hypothetical protein
MDAVDEEETDEKNDDEVIYKPAKIEVDEEYEVPDISSSSHKTHFFSFSSSSHSNLISLLFYVKIH